MTRAPRVPEKVTSPIRRLRNRIGATQDPMYLPVEPVPNGEINDCFSVVARHIEKNGGSIQYGWAIWFIPGLLMEAEFHAVWKAPDGHLVDLMLRPLPFTRIMFLADPHRVYHGRQVDNIRVPLSKDPRVREFVFLAEARFRLMNEGDLANKHGLVEIDKGKMLPVIRRMAELTAELDLYVA